MKKLFTLLAAVALVATGTIATAQDYLEVTQETTLVLTKEFINANSYVSVTTDDWKTNSTYCSTYTGDWYNMSKAERQLTINVKGVASFDFLVQNSNAGRSYTVSVGEDQIGTVNHTGTGCENSSTYETGNTGEITIGIAGTGSSVYPIAVTLYPATADEGEAEKVEYCRPDGNSTNANDRRISAITISDGSNTFTISPCQTSKSGPIYIDKTAEEFTTTAGSTINLSLTVVGEWMHHYAYIDYNNDGKFTPNVSTTNAIPQEGSELVTFDFYGPKTENVLYNPSGTSYTGDARNPGSGTINLPTFTLPADLKPGKYRVRVNRDWNCIDPCGNSDPSNLITTNGGAVIDFTLVIEDAEEPEPEPEPEPTTVELTYHLKLADGREVASQTVTANIGEAYPTVTWTSEASTDYYTISAVPEGNVEATTTDADLLLTHKLPFEVSADFESAKWYWLKMTPSYYYISHSEGATYLPLNNQATPSDDDHYAQWAFVGDVINGFKIYNRAAGAGKIFSASTTISGDGENTYPVMTDEATLPDGNNTYWMPIKAVTNKAGNAAITVTNGFFLQQLGYPDNRLNNRNQKVAFYTTGYGDQSAFSVEEAPVETPKVEITYNLSYNGETVATKTVTASVGEAYPSVDWGIEASAEYYNITGIPEYEVENAGTIYLSLEHNLPFEVSTEFGTATWYLLRMTANYNYISHIENETALPLGETGAAQPAATDHNAQWAFVGNVVTGFKIYNRGAGESKIFSASETISGDGKDTYPVMTEEPVPAGNNTYWTPIIADKDKAGGILGIDDAFYLQQFGHATHRLNNRDQKVAFFTTGYGANSAFTVEPAPKEQTTGIEEVAGSNNAPVEFYNLQGMKVRNENLVPGIYIRKQGDQVTKVIVGK